jgi:hypothetical protein
MRQAENPQKKGRYNMKIYNVRIGIKHMPEVKKSFKEKNEAIEFYLQYHPRTPKELTEKDTTNPYHYIKILEII